MGSYGADVMFPSSCPRLALSLPLLVMVVVLGQGMS